MPETLHRELTAPGPQGPLKGTLVQQDGDPRSPIVLILPGSGPTDRDGNNALGVQGGPYRVLAEALGNQGIGTVRIDKRGMFGSAAAVADANAVTIDDYVADTQAWVNVITQTLDRRCVWLLGHSEGGLIALAAAARVTPLCGLILVAAPGQRMGDVLRAQLRANPANAPVLDDALAAIARLEAGGRVDVAALHPGLKVLFDPQVQGFLISAFAQDPTALAAAVDKPMLILQGEADLQVSVADARALAAAQPAASLVLLPDVNHVLRAVPPGDARANLASYADPTWPLAPSVVGAIAQFIDQHR
ncbi:alpha/beta hydrolase [Zavarzinia sp. CC-PAN008]|uniref:alpha/beta hydrolase n=1 Tax=Zavarzinia sp. CC-PAN008 TaxID=3243332 RepID=UPI003F746A81